MESETKILSSGIAGLDSVLHGGFPADHAYLIKGDAGTGKTSLVMQFLSEGVKNGESTVYVSFSESTLELQHIAEIHDWPIDDIHVCELAADISKRSISGSSIFHGAEVDLPDIVATILDFAEQVEPSRLAVDSLTELRNMAESHRIYRRALFQLKVSLEKTGTTTLFVGEKAQSRRTGADSLVHGVIDLTMKTPLYGPLRRYLEVTKIRGRDYESGFHDFIITRGGLRVFPRIRPREMNRQIDSEEPVRSGIESLDELLGGGLDRGTTSLLAGPAGTGKSTLTLQYAIAVAEGGENAVIYSFTEGLETIKQRATNLHQPLDRHLESGRIRIQPIDSTELSMGQFAFLVRRELNERQVSAVILDSINGFLYAMPDEQTLVPHLHDLLTYIGNQGAMMLMTLTLSGLLQPRKAHLKNLSYLADTILYLRYYENRGVVHKSITAMKHRTRNHSKDVRELLFTSDGIEIGEPLLHLSE